MNEINTQEKIYEDEASMSEIILSKLMPRLDKISKNKTIVFYGDILIEKYEKAYLKLVNETKDVALRYIYEKYISHIMVYKKDEEEISGIINDARAKIQDAVENANLEEIEEIGMGIAVSLLNISRR